MRILVTGGTGYVGSHAVAALQDSGHDVRLLVRRPEQVPRTFGPLGVEVPPDVVTGDVLDAAAVERAVEGCDAVVHAAAVFSTDPRRAEEMVRTNEQATRLVLETAVARGLDPVVHVSSTVALTRWGGSAPDLPLGDMDMPYARSKIASERVARALQDRQAPVTTLYPGSVYGPHDPYLGDQATRLAWVVRGRFPLWPAGASQVVDVRDVAATVLAVTRPGCGPRRYVVPGHHVTGPEFFAAVSTAIGRRRRCLTMPARVATTSAAGIDAVQRHLPARWRYPADREGAEILVRSTRLDDEPARRDLGIEPISLLDSIRDTVAWMVDAGHLPERYRPR
jgi:dihydroflavonol-4-reductase